jgi:cyclopropane-fatty-acyl-phospholipid synthase
VAPVADRLADLLRTTVGVDPPVRIRAWDGSEAGPADGPVLVVRSRRALRRLLWRPGELGLARAYVTGDIDVDGDLIEGLRRAWRLARSHPGASAAIPLRARTAAALRAVRLGAVGLPPRAPASEARLSGRLHTRRRDRAVIAHHYDLSNDFYRLLLDDHMAYSSAYFTHPGQSLHDAQIAKLDLICRKLGLKPGMHLLDVGCGWGSLILHAAQRYGVRATGITLSAQQRDFTVARAADRGLTDSVEVRLQDYRDFGNLASAAAFDAVGSIEMGEHVGEQLYPAYVRILYRALKPGGRLLLQQMSRRADAAPGGGAFIEAYIAPDMHMRPLWQTLRYLQDADFEILSVEAMREHYARTAEHWIETLENRFDEFVALQGEEAARVWRLYLAGGMLAFEEGRMGVDQILAATPAAPGR